MRGQNRQSQRGRVMDEIPSNDELYALYMNHLIRPLWSPWFRRFAWLPCRVEGRWVWLQAFEERVFLPNLPALFLYPVSHERRSIAHKGGRVMTLEQINAKIESLIQQLYSDDGSQRQSILSDMRALQSQQVQMTEPDIFKALDITPCDPKTLQR